MGGGEANKHRYAKASATHCSKGKESFVFMDIDVKTGSMSTRMSMRMLRISGARISAEKALCRFHQVAQLRGHGSTGGTKLKTNFVAFTTYQDVV